MHLEHVGPVTAEISKFENMERFQSSSNPCEKENLVSSHLDKNDNISGTEVNKAGKTFTLKKWNAVAMWSWDVECDTCAICRVQVMGKF